MRVTRIHLVYIHTGYIIYNSTKGTDVILYRYIYIDVHPLGYQTSHLPGNRDTMEFAFLTYWRRSSPLAHNIDRLLVPTLMDTQLLHTIPIKTQNSSSLAQRIIQMIILSIAQEVISVNIYIYILDKTIENSASLFAFAIYKQLQCFACAT